MNRRHRKFLNDLADLMQKHNASFETVTDWGNFEGNQINVSGCILYVPQRFSAKDCRELVRRQYEK